MKVKNGFKYKQNGWNYIHISGGPYERGLAHGTLLKEEIHECLKMMEWNLYDSHGFKIDFFIQVSNFIFKKPLEENFPEFFEEIKGIAKGSGVDLDELILWNNYPSLDYALPKIKTFLDDMPELKKQYGHLLEKLPDSGQMEGGGKDKCSAFMAIGDYTKDGKICCAHNSFDNFVDGQYFNTIIDIKPQKGHRILFQSAPGYISSQTDFFINSKGFIGTETTMGGFMSFEHRDPISCRIRKCMQYANTLDEYVEFLKKENSGDYANSWLIGDTKNNEIMRIELGLEFVNVERKKNGYFIGFNAPYDARIRNLECVNSGFDDIRRHQGARKVRLEQLMDQPYQPRGAVDGCVVDTESCKNMGFYGRWGSSCGTPFYVKEFIKQNMQWKRYGPHLHDRPSQPWTYFKTLDSLPKMKMTRSKRGKREIKNKTIKK